MPVFFAALAAHGMLSPEAADGFCNDPRYPTGLYLIVKQVSSQKGIRVALLRKKEEVDGKWLRCSEVLRRFV